MMNIKKKIRLSQRYITHLDVDLNYKHKIIKIKN